MVLLYSVSDTYLPDFVLHGTTNKDFGEHLFEDLKAIVRVSNTLFSNTNDNPVILYCGYVTSLYSGFCLIMPEINCSHYEPCFQL